MLGFAIAQPNLQKMATVGFLGEYEKPPLLRGVGAIKSH
jgi:hypothetical protein